MRKRINENAPDFPSEALLENEIRRERKRSKTRHVVRNLIFSLIVVAAIAVIIAMLVLPVQQVVGESMSQTLQNGDIVLAVKTTDLHTGDIVAFYYNNNVLIKRVIACAGDWVNITEDGVVSVNGILLDEPYVNELAFGDCDIELPYQVPENSFFVLGDHRATSIDSRNTTIGCIDKSLILGKLFFRVWPLSRFGTINSPAGYKRLPGPMRLEVGSGGVTLAGTWTSGDPNHSVGTTTATAAGYTCTIRNTAGYELPMTGGDGPMAFYVLGVLLILTAGGALLILRRRRFD